MHLDNIDSNARIFAEAERSSIIEDSTSNGTSTIKNRKSDFLNFSKERIYPLFSGKSHGADALQIHTFSMNFSLN